MISADVEITSFNEVPKCLRAIYMARARSSLSRFKLLGKSGIGNQTPLMHY